MKATITIKIDVQQWIEDNNLTFVEAGNIIEEELIHGNNSYLFGDFYSSDINVEIN